MTFNFDVKGLTPNDAENSAASPASGSFNFDLHTLTPPISDGGGIKTPDIREYLLKENSAAYFTIPNYVPNSTTAIEIKGIGGGKNSSYWGFYHPYFKVPLGGISSTGANFGYSSTNYHALFDINEWRTYKMEAISLTQANCYVNNVFVSCITAKNPLYRPEMYKSNIFSTSKVSGVEKHFISYVKIWENGELIRAYYPCVDAEGTICLWEQLSDTYLYPTEATLQISETKAVIE